MCHYKMGTVSRDSRKRQIRDMNFNHFQFIYVSLIVFLAISMVTARKGGKRIKAASVSPDEDIKSLYSPSSSPSGPTDKQLGEVYKNMGPIAKGMSLNLDSDFGAGRCNCVCEDN